MISPMLSTTLKSFHNLLSDISETINSLVDDEFGIDIDYMDMFVVYPVGIFPRNWESA